MPRKHFTTAIRWNSIGPEQQSLGLIVTYRTWKPTRDAFPSYKTVGWHGRERLYAEWLGETEALSGHDRIVKGVERGEPFDKIISSIITMLKGVPHGKAN
jgi:hypothetical protein